PLVHTLSVPPGLLQDGDNILSVLPPGSIDDILVGPFLLDLLPVKEALTKARIETQVRDKKTGSDLPCRITIVDERGDLAAICPIGDKSSALRPGVVYTSDGEARFGLLPGKYTLYATRGFEYGMDQCTVALSASESRRVQMQIAPEVPTKGWFAC